MIMSGVRRRGDYRATVMRGFVAFLVCGTCFSLATVLSTYAMEGTAQPPLAFSLKCSGTYNAIRRVMIDFSLENLSGETLWVLKWLTPLEGIQGRIFKVTCDGREIQYEGPLVSRIGPFKSDYVRIGPRSTASSQVDLSAVYRLPTGKECTVSFTGRILDVRQGETLKLEKGDVPTSMEIPGNSLSLRIASED